MDTLKQCVYNKLILKDYLENIYGIHYPVEIIHIIIIFYFKINKLSFVTANDSTILTTFDKIYVWGYNQSVQLGIGHNKNQNTPQELNLPNVTEIICGDLHTIGITLGKVYVWGYNYYGQLGLGHNDNINTPQELNLPNVQKIICGSYHTIAITKLGKVYIWGFNSHGQLGLGHTNNEYIPQELNLPNVKKFICGVF